MSVARHQDMDDDMMGMPQQQMLQTVAGRLVSLEEGLAALESHKKALGRHSNTVKDQISTAVERQLTQLRAREKHLLRQVELATTHQNCDVNVTQAQLLQHKGALSVTRSILDTCNAANGRDATKTNSGELRNTIASTVNALPHNHVSSLLSHTEKLVRIPLVQASINEQELQSHIQNWGKISFPGILPHVSGSSVGSYLTGAMGSDVLIPPSFEEYGDAPHHVLHKSVMDDSSSITEEKTLPPISIDVRRPYILAANKNVMRNKANGGKKQELVKWLHHMQLQDEQDSSTCSVVSVEDACQSVNAVCESFDSCSLNGYCRKNATEKLNQSAKWHLKQLTNNDTAAGKGSAGRLVLNHMSEILTSNDDMWTLNKKKECLKMKNCDASRSGGNASKKMKLDATNDAVSAVRTAVLYQQPEVDSWVLPATKPLCNKESKSFSNDKQMDVSDDVRAAVTDESIKLWLLCALDNKEMVCKETLKTTQHFDDKATQHIDDKATHQQFDDKAWLFNANKDNKQEKQVDNREHEEFKCMTPNSMSSFSIISEPEYAFGANTSWLLSN